MKQLSKLKPCPLCGLTPCVTDVYRQHVSLSSAIEYKGIIRCRCGLSFEKEWVENPDNPKWSDTDIIEEWNDLIEKIERR